jgi:hypothetical protein
MNSPPFSLSGQGDGRFAGSRTDENERAAGRPRRLLLIAETWSTGDIGIMAAHRSGRQALTLATASIVSSGNWLTPLLVRPVTTIRADVVPTAMRTADTADISSTMARCVVATAPRMATTTAASRLRLYRHHERENRDSEQRNQSIHFHPPLIPHYAGSFRATRITLVG